MSNTQIDPEYLDAIDPEVIRRSSEDFMFFILSLKIPSAEGPKRYSQVIHDFQKDTFESLAPSLHAVRVGNIPPVRRFWVERTKKAGKDSDLAACILWLMAFPRKPIKVQVCAANSKQAGIIKNRAIEILYYNPWLKAYVEIIESQIRNREQYRQVWTRIEATDSQGAAHGETPDLLVLNELVHVAKWRAMEDHMANADGVPRGMVIVSTNAGIKGTVAHVWRKQAITNKKRWSTHILSTVAPWINPEDVEEARRRDPIGAEFSRLWEGRWISGTGGAVTEDEIDRCFIHPGPTMDRESGYTYIGGLDLGVSKDHSGVAIIGINRMEGRLKVVQVKGFVPDTLNDEGKLEVDLMAVENYCMEMFRRYHLIWLGYDPAAGGSFMAQRLRRRGVNMKKVSFSSATIQTQMATAFVQVVKDGVLECYEDDEGRVRRDFGKFSIEHKPPSSYRLTAVADEFGHADVGVAIVLTLPRACEELGGYGGLEPDDVIAGSDAMSDEAIENMPDEFKDMISEVNTNFWD